MSHSFFYFMSISTCKTCSKELREYPPYLLGSVGIEFASWKFFFWVSFLFKVPLSLLHSQCPCLAWPDTHRDNAFVHTDMSGGGAQSLLQSIAPFQAAEWKKCKSSCTMHPYWPIERLSLIHAWFCRTELWDTKFGSSMSGKSWKSVHGKLYEKLCSFLFILYLYIFSGAQRRSVDDIQYSAMTNKMF